jgi:hypothetical protein
MTAGGWTVIMHRNLNADNIDFKLKLANYQSGFGDLNKNHFLGYFLRKIKEKMSTIKKKLKLIYLYFLLLGLDKINLLTSTKDRELMLFIDDLPYRVNGFKVLDSYNHYKLIVKNDIDNMPDGCSFTRLNNTYFSALDVDFDLAKNGNCSEGWNGGWWFTDCFDHSVCMTGLGMHHNKGVTKFTRSIMLIK